MINLDDCPDCPDYEVTCDACRQKKLASLCNPEEGDQWWCFDCCDKWEKDNNRHWHNGQPK